MRAVLLFALFAIGCAPRAMTVTPDHPAHPDAEPGRLAGPPSALRPGVVTLEAPARTKQRPAKAPAHQGHP